MSYKQRRGRVFDNRTLFNGMEAGLAMLEVWLVVQQW